MHVLIQHGEMKIHLVLDVLYCKRFAHYMLIFGITAAATATAAAAADALF